MSRRIKDLIKSITVIGYLIKKYNWYCSSRCYYWMTKQMHLIDPAEKDRAKYWLKCGVQSTGKFKVGYGVYFDAGHGDSITVEDDVWIASESLILCHRRVLDDYMVGDNYNKLPFKVEPVTLKRGCCVGMRSIIMPGVTIGEGSIVAAGSLVTKDIPPYTVAAGRPAKVVREFPSKADI